jgi:oligopeptidase A
LHTERGQNRKLFEAYQPAGRAAKIFANSRPRCAPALSTSCATFAWLASTCPTGQRQRYAEISLRLSELGNQFRQPGTRRDRGYSEHFSDRKALAGLPESELGPARRPGPQAEPGRLAGQSVLPGLSRDQHLCR